MRLESTRFRLVLIGLLIAFISEIAGAYGVELPADTLYMMEGLLLALAGLDTVRPLGRGYPRDEAAEPTPVVAEEAAEPEPAG